MRPPFHMKHSNSRKRLSFSLLCFLSLQPAFAAFMMPHHRQRVDGSQSHFFNPHHQPTEASLLSSIFDMISLAQHLHVGKRKRTSLAVSPEPTAEENASSPPAPPPPIRDVEYPNKQLSPNNNNYNNNNYNNNRNSNNNNYRNSNNNYRNNNNNHNNYRNSNNYNSANGSPAKALNQQLVKCESAKEVLDIATSNKLIMTHCAGGGTLNTINFSTGIHRMARHVVQNYATRGQVLADPRFAVFLCAMAEAMAGLDYTQPLSSAMSSSSISSSRDSTSTASNTWTFQSREMSNIAWALAKLRLIPPQSILPMPPSPDSSSPSVDAASYLSPLYQQLAETSLQVRSQLLEAARRRKAAQEDADGDDTQADQPLWITSLSRLAAIILDTVSYSVLSLKNSSFQSQEWSNLLWAMATSQRADPLVFDFIALRLMDGIIKQKQQEQQQQHDQRPHQQNNPSYQTTPTAARPQECSNSIWAFATAQMIGPVQEKLLVFVADLMEDAEYVESFKPQELSNTAWGVATLLGFKKQQQQHALSKNEEQAALRIFRHVTKALITRTDEFKSQELSNSAWAMATLGFGQWSAGGATNLKTRTSENNDMNDYIVLASDQVEEDEMLLTKALEALTKSALPRLSSFRSQELNNLAWSLARLLGNPNSGDRLQPNRFFGLMEGIGRELCDTRRKATSQDVGTTLWSFATLEFFHADVFRGIASRLDFQHGRDYKPQELSNTVWALANNPDLTPQFQDIFDVTFAPASVRKEMMARADPVTICFATAGNELMRRPYDFKPQEIKDVLWSFSKAGLRHPLLFRSVAEHLAGSNKDPGRSLDDFSPQGVGNLAWAFARQAQLAQGSSQRYDSVSAMHGRLASYTATFLDIGEVLIKRLFACIADTNLRVNDRLGKLKPQDLSNSCWAFAILGLRHTQFMEAARQEVKARMDRFVRREGDPFMTRFKGQELANLVWALATLNCQFDDLPEAIAPYMRALVGNDQGEITVKSISRAFNRQELANIAWSTAVIGIYPRELMQLLYQGLVGYPNESDPGYLRQQYGDAGLQMQATMSLLYLQMALDMENPQNSWVLPENFPDGWYSMSDSSQGASDGMETTSEFELNLSTSKIQKSVSYALSRIGFQHVQEHVISMKELVDQGIQFSPLPIQLLSIDIADVSRKVGIEVDGPAHFLSVIDTIPEQGGEMSVVNGKVEYKFRWDDRQQQVNGPTALKQRLLSSLGWKVSHIPFWDWHALNGDPQLEDEYCRNLLSRI